MQYFKSSIEGIVVSSEKYSRYVLAKDGQLKGTEYKRNKKVLYRLFCRHFARTCSPTHPVLPQTWTALVSGSICKMAAALKIPQVFPQGSYFESAKAIQSPHLGLKVNEQSWQIPRHVRVCPRVTPPPFQMVADKCITRLVFRPVAEKKLGSCSISFLVHPGRSPGMMLLCLSASRIYINTIGILTRSRTKIRRLFYILSGSSR